MPKQPAECLPMRVDETGVAVGEEVVEGAARDAGALTDVVDADGRRPELGCQLTRGGDETVALARQAVALGVAPRLEGGRPGRHGRGHR